MPLSVHDIQHDILITSALFTLKTWRLALWRKDFQLPFDINYCLTSITVSNPSSVSRQRWLVPILSFIGDRFSAMVLPTEPPYKSPVIAISAATRHDATQLNATRRDQTRRRFNDIGPHLTRALVRSRKFSSHFSSLINSGARSTLRRGRLLPKENISSAKRGRLLSNFHRDVPLCCTSSEN